MADSVSFKVPYRNLKKEAEVEMVGTDELHLRRIDLNSNSSSQVTISNGNSNFAVRSKQCSLFTLILSCTVAAGVQFGWALQLSLLTPYIQTLGIEHAFSSFIWLCGPITGLVVQPCVGIWSDKCTSKYGRRRPFILAGSLMISVAVIIIGFSADIGYIIGDTKEDCSVFKGTRTRAAFIFVIGFWMLDLANNTVQGPARALLADLSGPDQRNSANAIFCSWMAVGNILGFSAGASGDWHRWFPFLTSRACCAACGNLKAAFLVAVVFLTLCTLVTICFADEVPLTVNQPNHLSDSAPLLDDPHQDGLVLSKSKPDKPIPISFNCNNADSVHERDVGQMHVNPKVEDQDENFSDGPGAVLVNLLTSLRHLPPAMHSVLIVMALSWLSWFPFFLFDTDWMGREVYHGNPKGNSSEVKLYDQGVREGAFGLLLNSVVLGISSFLIQPMCQRMGAKLVWAMSNFIVFACMAGTAIISLISVREYSQGIEHVIGGSGSIRIASLVLFALLGFPLAITYSVPFSVTSQLTADSGGGQGLAIGVLNLAVVIPQMIVSLGAGPWDALFGGGNIPAFVLASLSALSAGVVAIRKLPNLSGSSFESSGFHIG
ncbi:sucrose transport protein SUC3 isoform X2 [Mangifera indica]|uniref:sucrose transport protein SUC3 isoform X2 n=1 Tax=Mangifera indica TaxID=29780 RepID=UPI001CF9F1C8|nr:sucrose transport protein SUC3 isoform X2 [Mangifera indica]